ncbi:MAG: DolP-mannose mannosyltransferase [Nocardioides sp.]
MSSVTDRRDPLDGRDVTMAAPPATPRWRLAALSRGVRRTEVADPLVVGLVALVVYALHGYHGVLDRDPAMFLYGGEHVAHGVPPYVAIFNSVGPLADAVPGLAIWLGHFVGVGPVLSARLLFTVLSALCCVLVSVLARDTLGSRAAGLVAPAVFLTFENFLQLATDGPREKTTMVLFLLGCLILLGRRQWLVAGACAALATLTWQPALAAALGALVAATLLEPRGGRRGSLLRFVAGGVVPSLAAVVYFWAAGAFSRAWDGFVVMNVRYTEQPSALSDPHVLWTMLWDNYHLTIVLAIVGLLAVLVLGVRAVPHARRSIVTPLGTPVARRLVVVASGCAAAAIWTVRAINGAPDLFVLLPFAAVGAAGVVMLVLVRLPGRTALVATAAVVCLGVVVAGTEAVSTRDDGLLAQRRDIAAVLGSLPGDPSVVTLNAPQVLALTDRQSPTPYQYFSGSAVRYLEATYPGGMRGFLTSLEALHPEVVAVGTSFKGLWPYGWLTRDYVRIGTGVGVSWYLSRSLGPDAIARARVAHHRALFFYRG